MGDSGEAVSRRGLFSNAKRALRAHPSRVHATWHLQGRPERETRRLAVSVTRRDARPGTERCFSLFCGKNCVAYTLRTDIDDVQLISFRMSRFLAIDSSGNDNHEYIFKMKLLFTLSFVDNLIYCPIKSILLTDKLDYQESLNWQMKIVC